MRGPVLAVSFDGVLQPLAFAQVVRVIVGLAKRGFDYHLLSLERRADLADAAKVERVERVLASAGIRWTRVGVDLNSSVRQSGEAFARIFAAALGIARERHPRLIHARGYQGTLVANMVRRLTSVPYLFDARGCWIDERPDWFSRPAAYAAGKYVERTLYANAAAVVTLTELHAQDIVEGANGRRDPSSVVTIPTCADYDEFIIAKERPNRPIHPSFVPSEVGKQLGDGLVLGIVGALNRSYLVGPTLSLVERVFALRDDARLLVLTQQEKEYRELVHRNRLQLGRVAFFSPHHEEMPSWLPWIDWGLLILTSSISKRGSMPTKLAEFFAAGVRPVAHGCNSEMTGWVTRAGSGIVLANVDDASLDSGARLISSSSKSVDDLARARRLTEQHFALSFGIERYASLLEKVVGRAAAS